MDRQRTKKRPVRRWSIQQGQRAADREQLVEAKNAAPFCSDAMTCMSTMRASRSSRCRIQISR